MVRNNRYSLRKTNNGLVSCIIGAFLIISITNANLTLVSAESSNEIDTSLVEESAPATDVLGENNNTEDNLIEITNEVLAESNIGNADLEELNTEESIDNQEINNEINSKANHTDFDQDLTSMNNLDINYNSVETEVEDDIEDEKSDSFVSDIIPVNNAVTSQNTELISTSPMNTTQDINAPEFISLLTDKQYYTPGEAINLTVNVKDESDMVTDVNLALSASKIRRQYGGSEFLFINPNTIEKNNDGIFTINFTIDTSEITETTAFSPYGLALQDERGNQLTLDYHEIPYTPFGVITKSGEELTPPKILEIKSTQAAYKSGEPITYQLTVRDESEITKGKIELHNETEIGNRVLIEENITRITSDFEGNHRIEFDIPTNDKTPSTSYLLSQIKLEDHWGNTVYADVNNKFADASYAEEPVKIMYEPEEEVIVEEEIIPFETIFIEDSKLELGFQDLVQSGQNGYKRRTIGRTYFGADILVEPYVISEQQQDPVNEIIKIGTGISTIDKIEKEEEIHHDQIGLNPTIDEIGTMSPNEEVLNLISIAPEKEIYQSGEPVKIISVIESSSDIVDMNIIIFSDLNNNPLYTRFYYIPKINNITKNNGLYTIEHIIDISPNISEINYSFEGVMIKSTNTSRHINFGDEVLNSNFTILPKEDDLQPVSEGIPEVIEVKFDKYYYKPGEKVNLEFLIKDNSRINNIYAQINRRWDDQPIMLSQNYNEIAFKKNQDGTQSATVSFTLPQDTVESEFALTHFVINNDGNYGFSTINLKDYFPIKLEVLNNLSVKIEKEVEDIPYRTRYIHNNDLASGQLNIIQKGSDGKTEFTTRTLLQGSRILEGPITTKEKLLVPIDEIIEIGTGQVSYIKEKTSELIPFKIEYIKTADLLTGEELVHQEGEVGESIIVISKTLLNNVPNGESVVSKQIVKLPTTKIVLVGTGRITDKVEVITEPIPFDMEYVKTAELPEAAEEVITEGINGIIKLTTTTPMMNNKVYGASVVSKEIVKLPTTKIVLVGTGKISDKVGVTTEVIPFDIEYVKTAELPEGAEEVITEGINGIIKLTTTTPMMNNKVYGASVVSKEIVKLPTTKIVLVGTGKISDKVEVTTEAIPFDIEYVKTAELPEAAEEVITEGINGIIKLTTTTPMLNNKVYGASVIHKDILIEPINKVVLLGTSKIEQVTTESMSYIEFNTRYVENEQLIKGEKRIIQKGIEGVLTLTTITNYLNGNEYGEPEIIQTVTTEPVEEIIEIGTKVDIAEETETIVKELETNNSTKVRLKEIENKYINVIRSSTLPETGEKEHNSIFIPASIFILAGLSLILNDKKIKVEETE
ncbi:G5 domain-containing protein [Globicatella sulfidifaciens]